MTIVVLNEAVIVSIYSCSTVLPNGPSLIQLNHSSVVFLCMDVELLLALLVFHADFIEIGRAATLR